MSEGHLSDSSFDGGLFAGVARFTVSLVVIGFVIRYFGIWIIESSMQFILTTLRPGVYARGQPIRGPKWKIPNGTIIDKLINGRACSEEWQKYGPVYRIWAGPHPEMEVILSVITTPEDLRIFHSDSDKHCKPLDGNFGWFAGQVLGRCLGLLEGAEWKHRRQIFEVPFRHGPSVARMDITESGAKKFVDSLPSLALPAEMVGDSSVEEIKGSEKTFTLHAVKAFMKFPFYLTAGVVYGDLTVQETEKLWNLAEKHMALLPYMVIGGPYRLKASSWLHRSAYRKLQEYTDSWHRFNEEIVKRKRSEGINVPVVAYWDEYDNGKITLAELLHTLDEILMANLDISTHVLTWMITLIADNKDAEIELRAEVEANKDNFNDYLAKTDTHLHYCFYESMRLRPATIFNIGSSSSSTKDFRGILVKPHTMILVDTLAINIRNPFWGKDSESFNPARFKNIKTSDLRYNLNVFGFGYRKCPGQYLGAHMIKAAIAHLFTRYDVRVIDGRAASGDYKVDKSSWIPMADVKVQLTSRAQNV